jgi:pimeloyl-ACP methyl ester carboxylesterase
MFGRFKKPKTVKLGKYRLMYQEYGSGPPLLLVHGLSGSGGWWRRNVPALDDHFTVYVVELVGYGHNRAWRPVRIQDTADLLAELIANLPPGRAHVLGHSMGGQIVTHLAAQHPERVDRLVLACASGLVRSDLVRMALRLPGAGRYARLDFAPTLAFDALRAGPVNLLLSALDILSNDVSEALEMIVAPTLLVWGAQDKLVPVSVGETVQKGLCNARLEVIANAGHVVMWDQPEIFNRLVLDFLLARSPQADDMQIEAPSLIQPSV